MFDVVVEIVCLFEHVLMVTLHRVVCPVIWTSRFRREVFFGISAFPETNYKFFYQICLFEFFFYQICLFFWRKTRSALSEQDFTRSALSEEKLPDLPF